jgi:hypothetical protein
MDGEKELTPQCVCLDARDLFRVGTVDSAAQWGCSGEGIWGSCLVRRGLRAAREGKGGRR